MDADNFVLKGYQADLHPKPEYFGMMYGEKTGRGIIAQRFQRVVAPAEGKPEVVAEIGDKDQELVDSEWNELRIVAVGNRMVHQVNGVNTMDLTDNHPEAFMSGKLGLQLHAGPPMQVEFKDLKLRALKGDNAQAVLKAAIENTAKAPKKESAKADAKEKGGKFDWVTAEPKPQWIWRADKTDNEPIYLRHSFEIKGKVKSARLYSTCDNGATLWINNQEVGTAPDWGKPITTKDAGKFLKTGVNQIAVDAHNRGGSAAFILKLAIQLEDGSTQTVISKPDWKLALKSAEGWKTAGFDDSSWTAKLQAKGAFGVGPWGLAGLQGPTGNGDKDLEDGTITVAKGFKVEMLYEVPKEEQGSWVSLTVDPKGRLLASDQGDKGLHRITITDHPEKPQVKVEKMPVDLSGAQGLVWHQDSLYFHRNGGHLSRVTDSNGDDLLDAAENLPSETSGGEHGNHGVIVAEDGQHLYVNGGNHAELPPAESIVRKRVQSWDEDLLLPRVWDANGHARGRLAPGGWVTRFDPVAKTHDLISMGYRNEYDISLNRFGDLFTYDADMEWDMGAPWYRPTRINHVVSGSDYGWRSGSGKWPPYFEDSLPSVVDIGPGSPTGLVSGQGAKFPAKYQDALFALDWTFGTIYAIHLTPDGAGYRGVSEPFCYGEPLPVTDAIVGKDGALYFTVGGRGTQSALFRITYVGDESTAPPTDDNPKFAKARELRRSLEAFHGIKDDKAVTMAWPHLASQDRWLRNAARVAIESQPLSQWQDKVFTESNAQARITSAVALARMGDASHLDPLLKSLLELDPGNLNESEFLGLLRAYDLAFIRLGKPNDAQRAQVIAELDPFLPSESGDVNTELVRTLVYLESPTVISKTIELIANRGEPQVPDWTELAQRNSRYGGRVLEMLANHPPTHEINYAFMLRNLRHGWSIEDRRVYFEFINSAAQFPGGNSFAKFLTNLRDEALGYMTNEERAELADVTGENFNPVPDFEIKPPKGPGQNWTGETAVPLVDRLGKADFENGRSLFHAVGCAACHRFGGLGGDIGPDLTTLQTKFDQYYILHSIIYPSDDISDQYSSKIVTLKNGDILNGIVVERGEKIEVYPAAKTAEELKPTVVTESEVATIEDSPVSQMPPMLINGLNGDEVRDLIAYLMSGGDPKARVYR